MEQGGRKTAITIVVIVVVLVILVGVALFAYNKLTQDNAGANVTTQGVTQGDGSDDVMGSMNPNAESTGSTKTEAPDFTVMNSNEMQTSLSEFKGKPVVINFWATWCPYCVEEMPGFQTAYETYNSQVQFMMIDATDGSRETLGDAQSFLAENGYTFPAFFDTEQSAVTTYGLTSFPTTYFINADGTVYGVAMGKMDESRLNQTIEAMLAAQ